MKMKQKKRSNTRWEKWKNAQKEIHLRGIYGQFVLSYTAVLLLPVILSLLVYMQSMDLVRTEIERANDAMLRQTQLAIDDRMLEIQRAALQLAGSEKILQAVVSERQDAISRLRYYDAMQELKSTLVHNALIGDLYLFCNKFNKIITPAEQVDRATFYNDHHATDEMTYDEWLSIIESVDQSCYRTLYINNNQTTSQVFAYFQLIPSYQTQTPYGTLVVIIDEYELKRIIQDMEWVNRGSIYVLDSDDQVLFSNTGENDGLPVKYRELEDEKKVLYRRVNGERVAISYVAASPTDWKYVVVMPYNVFWENAVYINMLFLAMGLLVLISGALLIRYVARRNYSPIRQIMQNISEKSEQSNNRWVNEYAVINQYLRSRSNEQERLKQLLEDAQRERYLESLLTTGQADERLFSWWGGGAFQTPLFAVVILHLDDFSSLFPDEEYQGEKAVDIVRFSLKNLLAEVFSKAFLVYTTEINGMITAILNPLEALENAAFEKKTADLLAYMREFFAENMQVYFTAAVSTLHHQAEQIAQANSEALRAMEYRLILGKNRTIFYTEIRNSPRTSYTYSIASEQKLINSIVSGNADVAEQVLKEVFDQSGARQMEHLQTAKCLMYDLASTMLKVFNYVEDDSLFQEIQPLEQIIGCETLDDLEQCVQQMAAQLSAYFEEQKQSSRLSDHVREYVNHHYGSADVNVNMLGDHFGMTPSYLSKIFKKETGGRLSEYISSVRIAAAKQLLEGTTKSIADISTQVGYIDSNAFILAFKKKEGITPGQYRANFQGK